MRKAILFCLTALTLMALPLQAKPLVGGGDDSDVKLIIAEGRIFYREIFITWSTEYEKEPCEFIIEASADGDNWTMRGKVKSEGAADEVTEYRFVDQKDERFRHYRIRKLSRNGSLVLRRFPLEDFSIKVDLKAMAVNNEASLVLSYDVDQDQELIVRVYNQIGEQVMTKVMPFSWAGSFIVHLDVSHLNTGNYLLVVTQVLSDKVVAEKAFKLE